MDGKRVPSQQGGPALKRGPSIELDDLIEEDLAADDGPAYLPDDLDVADPELGEAGRNWTRPQVAPFNPEKDSLGQLNAKALYFIFSQWSLAVTATNCYACVTMFSVLMQQRSDAHAAHLHALDASVASDPSMIG